MNYGQYLNLITINRDAVLEHTIIVAKKKKKMLYSIITKCKFI